MRIIQSGPQHLTAWNILECGRNAAMCKQSVLFDGFGDRQSWLGCSPRAQQQHRLVQFAARLGQRECRKVDVVQRGFAHYPINQIGHSLLNLFDTGGVNFAHFCAEQTF